MNYKKNIAITAITITATTKVLPLVSATDHLANYQDSCVNYIASCCYTDKLQPIIKKWAQKSRESVPSFISSFTRHPYTTNTVSVSTRREVTGENRVLGRNPDFSSLLFTVTTTVCSRLYFFKLTQPLTVSIKEIENHIPFPMV